MTLSLHRVISRYIPRSFDYHSGQSTQFQSKLLRDQGTAVETRARQNVDKKKVMMKRDGVYFGGGSSKEMARIDA